MNTDKRGWAFWGGLTLRRAVLLILGTGLLACSAGGARQSEAPQQPQVQRSSGPKRIVAAIWGDPSTLNPTMNATGAGGSGGISEIALLVNVGLADVDFTTATGPRLAEQVPSL